MCTRKSGLVSDGMHILSVFLLFCFFFYHSTYFFCSTNFYHRVISIFINDSRCDINNQEAESCFILLCNLQAQQFYDMRKWLIYMYMYIKIKKIVMK